MKLYVPACGIDAGNVRRFLYGFAISEGAKNVLVANACLQC